MNIVQTTPDKLQANRNNLNSVHMKKSHLFLGPCDLIIIHDFYAIPCQQSTIVGRYNDVMFTVTMNKTSQSPHKFCEDLTVRNDVFIRLMLIQILSECFWWSKSEIQLSSIARSGFNLGPNIISPICYVRVHIHTSPILAKLQYNLSHNKHKSLDS